MERRPTIRPHELTGWIVLAALASGSCIGVVDNFNASGSTSAGDPGSTGDPGGTGNGAGTGGGTGTGGSTGTSTDPNNPQTTPSAVCTNPAGSPVAVPLQRITDTQYSSIITALFGTKVTVTAAFPPPLTGYLYSTYSGANPMGQGQTQAALDAAEAVAMQVADTVPACSSTSAETSCATTYLKDLAKRAFRRAATTDEANLILAGYTKARPTLSYAESVAIGVETILQMPQFLYVLETQPTTATAAATTLTGPELAQRMALLYWNGLPDQTLLDAATSGALADPNNRFTQAQRMMQDARAHGVFTDFLLQWMKVKGFHADVHAADVQAALDEEMRRDIDRALTANNGLSELVASQTTFVNSVLEKFYGLSTKSTGTNDWYQVDLSADQRVGILTHPMLLAKFAHGQAASPILRGKFIRVMTMCDDIAAPPAGAQAMQDTLTPTGATVREQSQARLNNATCGVCHKLMDPIGFGFSAFDGAGKYAPTVSGQKVDVTGHIDSGSDLGGDFNGVRELGTKLAKSPKVQACLAAQWMRYAFGTQETSVDQCSVQGLADRFGQKSNSLPALFAGISAMDSFAQRRAVTGGSP